MNDSLKLRNLTVSFLGFLGILHLASRFVRLLIGYLVLFNNNNQQEPTP
ncbi:hypothetical protein [Pseudomonas sp. NFACC39-1]|nr:hypothetical protein [Pseudomonas sp. NFACC39-1]SEO05759.1 hypothetical protein SAMN03159293_01739 [Pseudomonas sp. NFACC39-1]